MTPKKLWIIAGILFTIYVTVYIKLALAGIHTFSLHLTWVETLIMSVVVMLTLSTLVAALIALVPFARKKYFERFTKVTLPVATSIFIILFGLAWGKDLYKKHNQPTTLNKNTSRISADYPVQEDRVEVLRSEIEYYSEFSDAEFKLYNVNGFEDDRSVPGASSWNYEFIIKVDPSDVDAWTAGLHKTTADSLVLSDGGDLIPKDRLKNWKTESEPEFYSRDKNKVRMLVYRKEGIILKKMVSN